MPEPNVYADSIALISLARIGRLDLLTLLSDHILVTRQVWIEICASPEMPGAPALMEVRDLDLIVVVDEGDPARLPTLDLGEATVLSAAVAARAHVILDERKARRLIQTDADVRDSLASLTGVLGLILLAKEEGRIPAIRPLIESLIREDFWIGRRLLEELLVEAGEN